ncbi:MAG: uncharacterized protein KVP18_004877 [Porospora cf. gigantea A]|uniref:uncharacterized protein n=1 Tax=Porospora cf. gigantea A TaxID=2853593 RepID=UPI00355A444E|nr:MAG: hypothetical protein KVP18_004877 [Porospora cf. gigantea A]
MELEPSELAKKTELVAQRIGIGPDYQKAVKYADQQATVRTLEEFQRNWVVCRNSAGGVLSENEFSASDLILTFARFTTLHLRYMSDAVTIDSTPFYMARKTDYFELQKSLLARPDLGAPAPYVVGGNCFRLAVMSPEKCSCTQEMQTMWLQRQHLYSNGIHLLLTDPFERDRFISENLSAAFSFAFYLTQCPAPTKKTSFTEIIRTLTEVYCALCLSDPNQLPDKFDALLRDEGPDNSEFLPLVDHTLQQFQTARFGDKMTDESRPRRPGRRRRSYS